MLSSSKRGGVSSRQRGQPPSAIVATSWLPTSTLRTVGIANGNAIHLDLTRAVVIVPLPLGSEYSWDRGQANGAYPPPDATRPIRSARSPRATKQGAES